jgi:hypothetical protein
LKDFKLILKCGALNIIKLKDKKIKISLKKIELLKKKKIISKITPKNAKIISITLIKKLSNLKIYLIAMPVTLKNPIDNIELSVKNLKKISKSPSTISEN